jgi:transcriptional regulator with XRE-family HTH domain
LSRGRRAAIAIEADRLARDQLGQIGREVRASRRRRAWTQAQLAERSGLARDVVGRIELAKTRLDVDALQRIGLALGRRLQIRFGRDSLDEPVDAGHLAMQELVLRLGRAAGCTGSFELPTRPAEPWRSIDVVLGCAARRFMILCECWNTIGDIGAAVRSTTRKAAELEAMAAGRFGPDVDVGTVWVVRATARNRSLVARYPEVFASRFPGSSRQWVEALNRGPAPPKEAGLVWCDIAANRLFAWRQPARVDADRA